MKRISLIILATLLFFKSYCTTAQNIPWTITISDSISENTRNLIFEITSEAQKELQEIFPDVHRPMQVIISLDSAGTIAETGNAGFPLSLSAISFKIHPNHPIDMDSIISRYYKATLYHEYNHIVRGWTAESSWQSNDFMDAVVAEGLATIFEVQFTHSKPLWSAYPQYVENWVIELIKLPPSAYREYGKWMFEHPDGRKWIGYKAGTYIVEKALKKSGIPLE